MSKRWFAFIAVLLVLNFLFVFAVVVPDWWIVGNLCSVVVFAYLLGRDED